MSDGCHEEHRMTCAGYPKVGTCERTAISEELLAALLKLSDPVIDEIEKVVEKAARYIDEKECE